MSYRQTIQPFIDRCNHVRSRIQESIVFIRKAIGWFKVLQNAQLAIEGFNHDGEALVELLFVELSNAGEPDNIPRTVIALMFLEPEILRNWIDNYSPGQCSDYTHPEAVEEFESTYGSLIRRSQETSKITESGIEDAHYSSL